ncbi:MAG TPA: FAD-binding oxidoreductase [Rhizomicrobium sp.]|nr:FAD-binding oxidoreductase [Rhizomicrobium sp.]
MSDALSRLKDAVGAKGFSEDPREIAPHVEEWRGSYKGNTPLLLKPATTEEVSRALAICNETNTPIVPQGGNTGLVGGQIPFNGEVLLSLERLNRIRHVDKAGANMIVEAGAILKTVQAAADDAGMLFPLSLASEGSATIGGNLSTNAGGVHVLRYGMAREMVLGLEVVLADGRVLDMLRTLRKDNTGYDLKQIFLGAEGTLGIITAAALKLFPKPKDQVTAFVGVNDPDAAVRLLGRLQAATGGLITAFELIPRFGLELVIKHIPDTKDMPIIEPWYVLAEGPITVEMLASGDDIWAGVIAGSEAQRLDFWKLRESMSEAQKKEGPSLKHDIAVPVAAIPDFIAEATAAVLKALPEARPVTFGHLGDGNLHFNFNVPDVSRRAEIAHIVHDIVHEFGGSISAEHGIGVMKRDELLRYKSAAEIDVMRALKHTLDPKNILNPGKVL